MVRTLVALALLACTACDRELPRLEAAKTAAELRLHTLERVLRATEREVPSARAARLGALDAKLPDRRGTLTSSISALLADVEGLEVDGSPPGTTHGQVVTEPVILHVPGGLPEVLTVLERLRALGRPWQLDGLVRDGPGFTRVSLHGFVFSSASFTRELSALPDVGPEEGTLFSGERDDVRRATRALVEGIAAREAELVRRGVSAAELLALEKAELVAMLLAELEGDAERVARDLKMVVDTLRDVKVLPIELGFSIVRGRRACTLRFDTIEQKDDVVAIATARYHAATDAKQSELVLASGRVCTLGIGPAPKR